MTLLRIYLAGHMVTYMNFVTGKEGVVFNRQMMSISGIHKVWKI